MVATPTAEGAVTHAPLAAFKGRTEPLERCRGGGRDTARESDGRIPSSAAQSVQPRHHQQPFDSGGPALPRCVLQSGRRSLRRASDAPQPQPRPDEKSAPHTPMTSSVRGRMGWKWVDFLYCDRLTSGRTAEEGELGWNLVGNPTDEWQNGGMRRRAVSRIVETWQNRSRILWQSWARTRMHVKSGRILS